MAPSPPEARDDLAGAPRVARYEVRERIGEGAMGVVFRAFDREMGREVALKTLRTADPEDLRHLKREFRSLADVSHPNLAQLYDLDTTGDPPFFAMELIGGEHFDVHVRRLTGRPEALRDALWQLALGLRALHAAGKHHRDLKPSNVRVEPGGRSVLLDFGLVTDPVDRARAAGGRFAGTPAYMAPEQLWGLGETESADWFGLGAMLYEALAGQLPFGRQGPAGGEPPPPLRKLAPGVPADLEALVMALLRMDPAERPAEAEILERLRPGAEAPRPRPSPRLAPPPSGALVGRRDELAQLAGAFEAARARGATLHVVGRSGMGKSALVEHFVSGLDARGEAVVLRSRCHPQESVPFEAVDGLVDELARWLAAEPAETLLDVLSGASPALARLFPVLGALPGMAPGPGEPDGDPAELRRRAFAELRAVLARAAAREPLLVWIDDLQWGDADSAPLLRALGETRAPGLLLVLSYRSDAVEGSALLEGLARTGGAAGERRLSLGPLSPDDTRELIARVLPPEARRSPGRIEAIAAEAGGSPFFVGELARSAATREKDEEAAPRVETVVQQRVHELPEAARRILEVVSLAGSALDRSLVLRAAGVGEAARPLVATLHQDCLVRVAGESRRPTLEPYHDRIRESVVERLDPALRRGHHRALAAALEAEPAPDVDALVRHLEGAGELERAGGYAEVAADRAAEALAFERAAELYARALAWKPGDEVRARSLRVRRAESLVNAGRGAAAAPVFLEAAMGAARAESLELRRRAAEQLLVSGRIDEGEAALGPLLAELGLRLPDSARAAMGWTALRLAEIAWLRLRGRRGEASPPPPETLTRIDLCYAAARGLSAVDTVRGAYLPSQGLALALRHGDRARIGRSLAAVGGAVLAPLPGPLAAWGRRMLDEARQLARETDDPYLLGVSRIAAGQAAVVNGDWRGAVEHSASGMAVLEERCQGVGWELNVAHTAWSRGLEEMGRLPEVVERAEALRRRSESAGDLYGEMVAALIRGPADVAAGHAEAARTGIREVLARWSQGGFHLQHLYALRIEMMADLHDGRAGEAQRRFAEVWPALGRSVLMRVPIVRIDVISLRARAALARAGPEGDASLRRAVRRDVRRLAREGRPEAAAQAAALDAALAAAEGAGPRARQSLDRAVATWERVGMPAHAACALWRKAELLGGTEGEALARRASGTLQEAGVARPERWVGLQVPGRFSPAAGA